jgi:signal transduction histidine kinase
LEQFRFDPYIQEQQPARLLCIPAKLYQEPRALLYLENDTMEADNRNNTIGLLISITTQVALSLESERLYARKEQLEKINKEQLFRLMQAEKSASVGFLVAEVAHEVNNPNQSILLNAAQLEEMWKDTVAILDEFCREEPLQIGGLSYSRYRTAYPQMVRAIKSSAVQIDSLVNELREFMKPKLTLEKQQIDVNSVIESTILIASHFIKTATDHFTFRTGTVPQVSGDQQKLQQVVLNLIRNSCQALPHKQASIEICTRYDAENKLVIIEVEDKGCGIEQDCLDKITEPFFSTKNDENGMGLGLYVCNSIVHEHGGTLHIESQPGFGTRVEVSLPCPL